VTWDETVKNLNVGSVTPTLGRRQLHSATSIRQRGSRDDRGVVDVVKEILPQRHCWSVDREPSFAWIEESEQLPDVVTKRP